MASRKKHMKANPDSFVREAMDALQFLDEIGGPSDLSEYVYVLTAIQAELGERIRTAVENEVG